MHCVDLFRACVHKRYDSTAETRTVAESDDYPPTVKLRRPARVSTDDRGRTVWVGEIEETELELMSTGELKLALSAADAVQRESIKALADKTKQGVVVRNCATGLFDVISESELRAAIDRDGESPSVASRLGESRVPSSDDEGRELTLVSTQALRRMLHPDEDGPDDNATERDHGFDPYDRG